MEPTKIQEFYMFNDHVFYFDVEQTVTLKDRYVKKARQQKWRTRSSYKLLQIDEVFNIFEGVKRAVDLYSTPGSWTQVLSRKLVSKEKFYINNQRFLFYNEFELNQSVEAQAEGESDYTEKSDQAVIVALESYGVPNYPGVIKMEGDLGRQATSEEILKHLDGHKADLIVCRRFIDRAELQDININVQGNHMVLVIHAACFILRPGGTLVAAVYNEKNNDLIKLQLLLFFKEVRFYRPKVRDATEEIFVICKDFYLPEDFDPTLIEAFLTYANRDFYVLPDVNRIIIPFLVCGDLSTYPLSPDTQEYIEKFKYEDTDASSTSGEAFKLNDSDEHMKEVDEAVKCVPPEDNPDHKEVEVVEEQTGGPSQSKSEVNAGEENKEIDNGPLSELIQKTTKIKKIPVKLAHTHEFDTLEHKMQFLYEDENTDINAIKECLDRLRSTIDELSTCICEFPIM